MAYEVSVAVQIRENGSEGSLVAAMDSQTLPPVAWPGGRDPGPVYFAQVFAQMELLTAVVVQTVMDKAVHQVQEHKALAERGEHPMLSG